MKILLSNDDGVYAPGLACLAEYASKIGEVTVVAPDRNKSGASHSLTLDRPLRVMKTHQDYYSVNGTPSDCVHAAITGLLDFEPDIVVSGINDGSNVGDDVLYSGTVAAATEGRFLGLPSIAISLATNKQAPKYFETAGRVVERLLQEIQKNPLPLDNILNVNVPDIPFEKIKGFQVTRLGNRHRAEPIVAAKDPRGRTVYWVGPAGAEEDAGPGTDFYAINNGFVSITPLQMDLTRYNALDTVKEWVAEFDYS
jgi:5'-nucleotidase